MHLWLNMSLLLLLLLLLLQCVYKNKAIYFIIIIIIKNECHSDIIVDRFQGCGHSTKLRESESESRSSKVVWQAQCQL